MNCWKTLAIDPTRDKRTIKRAYAKLLKKYNPEDNPEAFQVLREAYDQAIQESEFVDTPSPLPETTNNITRIIDIAPHDGSILDPLTISLEIKPQDSQLSSTQQAPVKAINEAKRVRSEQSRRIAIALAEIKSAINTDEEEAIALSQDILARDYFKALDVRYRIEGELLILLSQSSELPIQFVQYLEKEFEWDIDLQRRPSICTNQFMRDHEYAEAFRKTLRKYLRALVTKDITDNYALKNSRTTHHKHVEALLFGPYDANKFRIFEYSPNHKNTLRQIYRYIKLKKYDEIGLSPIRPEVEAWILSNKNINHLAKNVEVSPPLETKKVPSAWLACLFIIIIIQLLNYVANPVQEDKQEEHHDSVEWYRTRLQNTQSLADGLSENTSQQKNKAMTLEQLKSMGAEDLRKHHQTLLKERLNEEHKITEQKNSPIKP